MEKEHLSAELAAAGNDTTAVTPERQAHTPGPWKVVKGDNAFNNAHHEDKSSAIHSGGDDPFIVAEVCGDVGPEHEHNAHLIAAAPELLEALKRLLDEQNGAPLIRNAELWQSAVDAGFAAIAKAEGR